MTKKTISGPPPPTILVPGITASVLHDEYSLPPEAVWTALLKRQYERITLHPENQRYELIEPARVAPGGPFPLVYEDLIEELRDALSQGQDGPVPVFPFGYDWRMPLDSTEERLASFVCEVIERTLLLPHYRESSYGEDPTVNLIGHSMGGLIIAGYIQRHGGATRQDGHGGKGRVSKVVTLASPFSGSYEAVLKVVTGTGDFGDDPGKPRERRMARMTPSLYYLLPSFPDAVKDERGRNVSLFDADEWQPSVVDTIEEQVKGWKITGRELFGSMLGAARSHRDRISSLELRDQADPESATALSKKDWLAVVGVDSETRVGLRAERDGDPAPRFVLGSAERCNQWSSTSNEQKEDDRRQTGDGTVPLAGAVPPFLDESSVVCVTPGDFGYWELGDRGLSRAAGFHAAIPKMNMLHRLIIRFFLEHEDRYDSTWGRRVPGVSEWQPPLNLREKGARAKARPDSSEDKAAAGEEGTER